MHFADTVVRKLHIYLVVVSFVVCLLGIAVVKLSVGGQPPDSSPATNARRLTVLERLAPKSPEMCRFLDNEKAKRESDREVNGGSQ